MMQRVFFLLAIIFYIFIVGFTTALSYSDGEGDSDGYNFRKRLFFGKSSAASTQRTPSVLDNLINPSKSPTPVVPNGPQQNSFSSSDFCASNPCEHGGACIRKGQTSYECKCVGPWRGLYCGIADACYNAPCQNGGQCHSAYDDYWCECSNGYYGAHCQKKTTNQASLKNHCEPNTCRAGRCIPLETTYYCECPKDRYGEHCEKRIAKRETSNINSYRDFLRQLKRGSIKSNKHLQNSNSADDVAYYDVKNGIYF